MEQALNQAMLAEEDKSLCYSPAGRKKVGEERKEKWGMGKKGGKEREGGREETELLN